MRKLIIKFLFLFIFLIQGIKGNAQVVDNTIDSLIQLIKKQEDDTNKLHTYESLLDNWRTFPYRLTNYIEPALNLAKKLDNKTFQVTFYAGGGRIYYEIGDIDQALQYYFKGVQLAEKEKDYYMLAQFYSLIANIYLNLEDYSKSLNFIDKQLPIIETYLNNEEYSMLNYLSQKSRLFNSVKQYDSALKYTHKLVNISGERAKHNSEEARHFTNDLRLVAVVLINQKQYQSAQKYLDSCKYIIDTLSNKEANAKLYSRLYFNYATLWEAKGENAKALVALEKSAAYAQEISNLQYEMEAFHAMANVYGLENNYKKQVEYLNKFHHLKDSMMNTDKKVKMTELESNYQLERKNNSLAQKEVEIAKQKNQRNFFIYLASIVFIGIATLATFYRRIRSKNQKLGTQNNLINNQKVELEKLNLVKDKMFSVISHDLRQPINTLKAYFTLTKQQNLSPDKLKSYQTQMEQSVNQTSSMMDNLLAWARAQLNTKTTSIENVNLHDCITNAIADVKSQADIKNISILNKLNVEYVQSNAAILAIAIRNILTNAIKFSPIQSSIEISSDINDNILSINIKDFGIGLSESQVKTILDQQIESQVGTEGEKGSGMGLILVMQLLTLIQAELKIISQKNEGSTFSILLPFNNNL